MKGFLDLDELLCICFAKSCFPDPVSPLINILALEVDILFIIFLIFLIEEEFPIILLESSNKLFNISYSFLKNAFSRALSINKNSFSLLNGFSTK